MKTRLCMAGHRGVEQDGRLPPAAGAVQPPGRTRGVGYPQADQHEGAPATRRQASLSGQAKGTDGQLAIVPPSSAVLDLAWAAAPGGGVARWSAVVGAEMSDGL